MKVKFKKLHPTAKMPTYATDGSGAFDLYAPQLDGGTAGIINTLVIDTHVAFEVPEGHVLFIVGRSGMAFKHDIRLANCLAVIDSDYRDSVKIKLTNDGDSKVTIRTGDRIAQGYILPVPSVEFEEVDYLGATERTGGLGSTGGFGDVAPESWTFEQFVQHGRDMYANIVNGMPWSFYFKGCAVTHENDNLYLISTPTGTIRFAKGQTLRVITQGNTFYTEGHGDEQ